MEIVVWALFKLSFEHFFVESALFDILSAHDVMHCLYASMLSSSRSDMSIMLWNFGTEKLSSPYSPRRDAVTLDFFWRRWLSMCYKMRCGNATKEACISTPYLEWYLIISELQNTPWPRPANAYHWFCKRNSSAALSEFNCDCRLRIDPSAADAEWPRACLVWHRGACQC